MRLGIIHQKKRVILNKLKISMAGFFYPSLTVPDPKIPSKIKNIILVHNNKKLGDLIVFSAIYRELKIRNISLTVVTDAKSADFLKNNDKIDNLVIKEGDGIKDILTVRRKLKKIKFDLAIDPFETLPNYRHALLLRSINAAHVLGFDKWYIKYYQTYDRHDENLKSHISTRVMSVMKYIDVQCNSVCCDKYDLPLSTTIEERINHFLDNRHLILFNPYGAKKICRLSDQQIIETYSYLEKKFPASRIIFTGIPEDLKLIPLANVGLSPFKTFSETVALTKHADMLISVDTALIHVAAAFSVPTVALYPKEKRATYPSVIVWGPNNPRAILAVAQGYYVKELPVKDIQEAIDRLY